jgi:hypothetical protein
MGCSTHPPTPTVRTMTDKEMALYRIDCKHAVEQKRLLEQQIQTRRYYTVDGVEWSEDSHTINKRFHALARHKIWSIETECAR